MPSPQLSYYPARIVKGHRWYIVYYQTDPDAPDLGPARIRETFNLNRVKDLKIRKREAERIRDEINALLPTGFPYNKEELKLVPKVSIIEALGVALEIKVAKRRVDTVRGYRSIFNIISRYLEAKGLCDLDVKLFDKKHAMGFLDMLLTEKDISAVTWNNNKIHMLSLFNVLKARNYVDVNPFQGIKKLKEEETSRRALTDAEKNAIAAYAKKHHTWFYYAVSFIYYCAIRNTELTRLKIYMIDLKRQVIRLPGSATKNTQRDSVTIQNGFVPILEEMKLHDYPGDYYIFSKTKMPGPEKQKRADYFNKKFKQILKEMQGKGLMHNLENVSFYSWKDTGALKLLDAGVDVVDIMHHLRHRDLSTTQRYLKKLRGVNNSIKALGNDL